MTGVQTCALPIYSYIIFFTTSIYERYCHIHVIISRFLCFIHLGWMHYLLLTIQLIPSTFNDVKVWTLGWSVFWELQFLCLICNFFFFLLSFLSNVFLTATHHFKSIASSEKRVQKQEWSLIFFSLSNESFKYCWSGCDSFSGLPGLAQ